MAKLVTTDMLRLFKTKQDTANEVKYMEIVKYVDNNGLIKDEKVQNETGVSVIPIHVVTSNSQTKYFTDNDGEKTTTEVEGASGKIYIDLESGSNCLYTYDVKTSSFIPFASSIATDADIDALFN